MSDGPGGEILPPVYEIKVDTQPDSSHRLVVQPSIITYGLHPIMATQLQESGAEIERSGGPGYVPPAHHPTGTWVAEWVSAVVPGGLPGLIAVLTAFLYRNRGKRFVIRHGEREIEIEGVSDKQARKLLTDFFPKPQPGTAGAGAIRDTVESGTPRDTGEAGTAPSPGGDPPPNDNLDQPAPVPADNEEGQE